MKPQFVIIKTESTADHISIAIAHVGDDGEIEKIHGVRFEAADLYKHAELAQLAKNPENGVKIVQPQPGSEY